MGWFKKRGARRRGPAAEQVTSDMADATVTYSVRMARITVVPLGGGRISLHVRRDGITWQLSLEAADAVELANQMLTAAASDPTT